MEKERKLYVSSDNVRVGTDLTLSDWMVRFDESTPVNVLSLKWDDEDNPPKSYDPYIQYGQEWAVNGEIKQGYLNVIQFFDNTLIFDGSYATAEYNIGSFTQKFSAQIDSGILGVSNYNCFITQTGDKFNIDAFTQEYNERRRQSNETWYDYLYEEREWAKNIKFEGLTIETLSNGNNIVSSEVYGAIAQNMVISFTDKTGRLRKFTMSSDGSTKELATGGPYRKLYEDAGATFNEETGYYEIGIVTDIDEEEMRRIYEESHNMVLSIFSFFNRSTLRTVLPFLYNESTLKGTFLGCANLIFVPKSRSGHAIATNLYNTFSGCKNLKVIDSLFRGNTVISSDVFNGCESLEEVRISNVRVNLNFSDCPKLSLESFKHLVMQAANEKNITVLVHGDVYAKLSEVGNTEWHKVMTDAKAKQITFIDASSPPVNPGGEIGGDNNREDIW